MITSKDFEERIDRFLGASGMSATKLGKEAVNDPNFVFQVREGRRPNLESVNKVLAFIEAQRADEAPKPKAGEAA